VGLEVAGERRRGARGGLEAGSMSARWGHEMTDDETGGRGGLRRLRDCRRRTLFQLCVPAPQPAARHEHEGMADGPASPNSSRSLRRLGGSSDEAATTLMQRLDSSRAG
jgi:hypothetical protein